MLIESAKDDVINENRNNKYGDGQAYLPILTRVGSIVV